MPGISFRSDNHKCSGCMYLLNKLEVRDKDGFIRTKIHCMIPNCVRDREIGKKTIKKEGVILTVHAKELREELEVIGLKLIIQDNEDRYADIVDDEQNCVAQLLSSGVIQFKTINLKVEQQIIKIVSRITKQYGVIDESMVL